MLYRFGPFELDEDRFALACAGKPVAVQPKPFALLLHLLRRHPAVVDHDELLEVVWVDAAVTRASIARAVHSLRRSLGEIDEQSSIIRSVRGRGYGLSVEVQRQGEVPLRARGAAPRSAAPFVGRDDVMQRISRSLATAAAGRGGVATVVGEPGIGKTRLLQAVGERAEAQGWLVLGGAATDDPGAPALWPWVSVLRDAAAKLTEQEIEAALGQRGSGLLSIEPELLPGHPAAAAGVAAHDEADERFRLFDEADAFLARLAAERPVLVVIDDLQWADSTSLELFGHLAKNASGRALFLLAGHRPDAGEALTALLDRLASLPGGGESLRLDGLGAEHIAEIAESISGRSLDSDARRVLHQRSGGNPFFALELTRADRPDPVGDAGAPGSHDASPAAVPERIRASVRVRVSELSHAAQSLLQAAAVLGEELHLAVLAEMLDFDEGVLLDATEEVEAAWLLVEDAAHPGRLRFVHALVPEALYEGMARKARVGLHARAARALEAIHGVGTGPRAAALAHHFGQSTAAGDATRAVAYATRAGAAAFERLAFAEAAAHYAQAIEWHEAGRMRNDEPLARLAIELARALYASGDPEAAERASWRAMELAEGLASPKLVVSAATRLTSGHYRGESAERLIEVLERALALEQASPNGGDPGTLSHLYGLVARTLTYSGDFAKVDETSSRALELARSAGDAVAELRALAARDTVLASEPRYAERAALSRDRVRLASELGEPMEEFQARVYRVQRLIQEIEPDEIDAELEELQRLAERLPHSYRCRAFVLDLQALRALWQGDGAYANALLPEIAEAWSHVDPLYSMMSIGAKRHLVAALSDDFEEIDRNEARRPTGGASYALPRPYLCALAHRRFEIGMVDQAREDFEFLSRHDYGDLQHDVTYLILLVQLAQLAYDLGDAARASRLETLLEPFAGRYASGHTAAVRGTVDRYRALLRWTLGDLAGADALLVRATEQEHAMRAPPWEALTRIDRARLLLERGSEGDRAKAAEELRLVAVACGGLDVPGITRRAEPLRVQLARV